MDLQKLSQIASSGIYDNSIIQRLGFVLDHPDVGGSVFANELYQAVKSYNFGWVLLNPGQKFIEGMDPIIKDDKWKILINEEIDTDI